MDGARPEGPGNEKTWTIGRLVQLLRDDFPDLSISKVRYLEDRNLLHPVRTAGGYRKYGEAELRQLRTILTLQRDEFLPLDIIRDRLARGTAIPFSRISEVAPLEEEGALWREERLIPEDEIIRTTGLDRDFLRQLSEFHLVDRDTTAIEPSVKKTDAEIARVCGELAKHGVLPRNLRLLRSSAEREVAMLEQVVAPALRSAKPDRREEGERTLQNLAVAMTHLYRLLLYKELRHTRE